MHPFSPERGDFISILSRDDVEVDDVDVVVVDDVDVVVVVVLFIVVFGLCGCPVFLLVGLNCFVLPWVISPLCDHANFANFANFPTLFYARTFKKFLCRLLNGNVWGRQFPPN
jgi:hypothetical protein